MGVILSSCKGRAHDFKLNHVLKRTFMYLLAAGIDMHSRWIISEFNPSDRPSRLFLAARNGGSQIAEAHCGKLDGGCGEETCPRGDATYPRCDWDDSGAEIYGQDPAAGDVPGREAHTSGPGTADEQWGSSRFVGASAQS